MHVGKDALENYEENIDKFKNAIEADNKKKTKYEEFNKLIANSDQSKYASLVNRLASQYPMKNYQYYKDIILAKGIMENNRHDYSGTIKQSARLQKRGLQ